MKGNYFSWLDQNQAEWHLRKKWLQNVENLERELDCRQGARASNEAESTFTELR
jgi:hypothetical protein